MAADDDDRIHNASSVFDGVRKWSARTLADCSAASGYAFTIDAPPTPEQVDAMCANSDCVVLLNEVLVGAFRSPQFEQMPEFDRPLGFFGYWMIEYCTFHHITDTPCGNDPLEQLLLDMTPIVSVCEARSGVSIRRAIQYSSLVRASGSKGTIPPLPPFAAMCDVAECDNIMRRLFMRISMPLCEVGVDTEAVKSPLMNSYMRECNTAARLSWYKEPTMPLPLLYTILPGPLPLDRILRPPTNATTAPPTARPSLKTKPPMPPQPVEMSPAPTSIPTESPSTTMPMTLPVVPRTTAAATISRTTMAPQPLTYASQAPTDSSGSGPHGGNEATVPPTNRQQRSMTPPPTVADVDESGAVVPIVMTQGSSEPVVLRFALIGVSTVLVLLIVWLLVRRRRRVLGSKETAHSSTDNASEYHSLNDTVSDSASVSGSGDYTIAHDLLAACPEIAVNQLDDVRIIGSGGYGVVYLVRDTLNKRLLASKRLGRNERLAHQVDAFVAEINLAATLSHPRIVTFVGVAGLHKTGLQALFEYMAGGDLKRYLDSQPPMDLAHHSWTPEKLQIAIDIADALAYLHTRTPKPVVHRDLKSRNVMLTSDGRAKLGDFGVSRTESAAGSMTTGVGTSRWVAPEVILGGGDYTTACDVYSFGVVLSELDTHRLPFSELVHTNGEQLADFVLLPLVALQRKQPSFSETCPSSILKVVRRCLAYESTARPTAVDVAEALRVVQREFGWKPQPLGD